MIPYVSVIDYKSNKNRGKDSEEQQKQEQQYS